MQHSNSDFKDRRFLPRYPCGERLTLSVDVYSVDGNKRSINATVCDSSALGIALDVPEALSVDDLLVLVVPTIGSGDGMTVLYRVVRCTPRVSGGCFVGAEALEFEPDPDTIESYRSVARIRLVLFT